MPDIKAGAPAIGAELEPAYEIVGGRADRGLVLLCDHASNALPAAYGTLGLPPAELERHIGYDIGAAAVTRLIAAATGAPAVLTRVSRLLIDPNRGMDDPTLIMRISDGAIVPGNRHLTAEEREGRVARYYRPYHQAIDRVIDRCIAAGAPPALLSIHSFTDNWKGRQRPWHVGILWDRDARLARPLIDGFAADPALVVGDNEPYHGALEGDCLWQHGTGRGLPNAIIEYRQDLVGSAEGQRAWARRTIAIIDSLAPRDNLMYGPAVTDTASAEA